MDDSASSHFATHPKHVSFRSSDGRKLPEGSEGKRKRTGGIGRKGLEIQQRRLDLRAGQAATPGRQDGPAGATGPEGRIDAAVAKAICKSTRAPVQAKDGSVGAQATIPPPEPPPERAGVMTGRSVPHRTTASRYFERLRFGDATRSAAGACARGRPRKTHHAESAKWALTSRGSKQACLWRMARDQRPSLFRASRSAIRADGRLMHRRPDSNTTMRETVSCCLH